MQVYLVEVASHCNYDGATQDVAYVASNYRKASQWLLDRGYIVYPAPWTDNQELAFIKSKRNKSTGFRDSTDAKIIEKKIDEV